MKITSMIGLWLRTSILLTLFIIGLLVVAVLVGSATQRQVIVYQLARDVGGYDLILMDVNTTIVHQPVDSSVACCIAWSPNGKMLAFSGYGNSLGVRIYLMNSDGSNIRRLTHQEEEESNPVWSPDGTKILFLVQTADTLEMRVININTGIIQQLETSVSGNFFQSWSPNGKLILWRGDFPDPGIYTIRPADEKLIQLNNEGWPISNPSFSPNGEQIVFVSTRSGNLKINIMNADGTDLSQLTYTAASEASPRWSPDGKSILFSFQLLEELPKLFVMNADGSNQKQLTNAGYYLGDGVWSPDGKQILFTSLRERVPYATTELFIINADGSDLRRLTYNNQSEARPAWQP